MINVKIYRDDKENIIAYEVKGHAGAAEAGYDIVCAAVSVLTQTPLIGLERHLNLKPQYTVDQQSGIFSLKLNEKPNEETQAILETMFLGLQSVAKQYSDYVSVKVSRR